MSNKWVFVYSEVHSLIMNEAFFNGFTASPKIPGMLRTILYVNKNGWQKCYTTPQELQRVKEEGKIFFNKKFRERFQEELQQSAISFAVFFGEYKRKRIKECTNSELLHLFEGYIKHLTSIFAHYQVGGGRSYPLLEEHIREKLGTIFSGKNAQEIYSLLMKSGEMDILEREETDMLRLASGKVTRRQLIKHAQKYAFRFFNTYDEADIISSLVKRIKEAQQKKQTNKSYAGALRKEKKRLQEEQKKVLRRIEDKELIDLILFLQEQARLRMEYKNWKNGAELKFIGLLREIAMRMNLSVEDFLLTTTIGETKGFLKEGKRVSPEVRNTRKQMFIFFKDDKIERFHTGKEAEEFLGLACERNLGGLQPAVEFHG